MSIRVIHDNGELQAQFDRWATIRHLFRDYIHIEDGNYTVTKPIVVDPGIISMGGNVMRVRGKGPEINAPGVVLRPAPDFQGDFVLKFLGVHPNVLAGLHVDARQAVIKYGIVYEAKENEIRREASGGRGMHNGMTIEGPFSVAALHLLCAEEMSFFAPNIYATGLGNAVFIENDKFSQTAVLFSGGSFYAYGNNVFRIKGWVNDTYIERCFVATPHAVIDATEAENGCYNNVCDVRFEAGSSNATILKNAVGKGWSKGKTRVLVSPLVAAMKPQFPVSVPK